MKRIAFVLMVALLLLVGCLEKKEKNPPYIELNIDGEEGDNGWYVSSITITLNAYDNESKIEELKYRINGDMWKDYVMPFRIQNDGFYFIEYYAKDGNGNEIYKNITIKIDKTEPTINFSNFEPGYIYFRGRKMITPRIPRDTMIIGDFTIEAEANDNLAGLQKVEFYLGDGIAFEDNQKPYEWEIESVIGVYNITAVAYDYAGNYAAITIPEVQIINL
ncbi:MAG: hypothetical protein DRN29_00490 [Thermoplasmata archaeon]|nr:MAG: hypothetical protein DRN29_00490 [Thermoplasmata archaeon]HDN95726.1 hypothetical protein [Thermoplasmatales archaeon]